MGGKTSMGGGGGVLIFPAFWKLLGFHKKAFNSLCNSSISIAHAVTVLHFSKNNFWDFVLEIFIVKKDLQQICDTYV